MKRKRKTTGYTARKSRGKTTDQVPQPEEAQVQLASEPSPIPEPEPHEESGDDRAYERAANAASGLPEDGSTAPPPPPEPARLELEAVLALLELLYSGVTEGAARAYGIEFSDDVRRLGEMAEWERRLLTAFGPMALQKMQAMEAYAQKYGGLLFVGTIGLGLFGRVRVLKRFADQMKRQREQPPANGASGAP
jgi:hypothetical protein